MTHGNLLALLFLFLSRSKGGSAPHHAHNRQHHKPHPADGTSAAAKAAQEAKDAADRARATQSEADAEEAARKAREAADAATAAAQIKHKASTQPPAWPQAHPGELPPFPGPGWRSAVPTPPAVAARAQQLLPILWGQGEGAHKVELTAGNWTAYRADRMGPTIRGVTAWVPRSQVTASA